MIQIELQSLVKRFSPELKNMLEYAANDCVSRTNFTIEIDHWFFCILQKSNLWSAALQKASINKESLLLSLDERINTFQKGNTSTPTLSLQLVNYTKELWLVASINYEQSEINEFHLLELLKQWQNKQIYQGPLSFWLEALSGQWLQAQAGAIKNVKNDNVNKNLAADPSSSIQTPGLDKYTHNLTQDAKDGKLDIIAGRGDEIRKVIDILGRRRQNSPILVGDAGVGKTAIVEGLAQQIVSGNIPPSLANVELRALDLTLLQAGASIKGEFENRLKDVINEIKQSTIPIIIFIDEAHSLIGAGGSAGQNDAANILKPALARGEFRSIAATTWAEYKQYFESDPALARRFQQVGVREPNEEDAINILNTIKASLEKHHNVLISKESIDAAVYLSTRYLTERKLPDKAISLLDTACSRIALTQTAKPRELEAIEEQIIFAQKQISILLHEAALWSDKQGHFPGSKLLETEHSLDLLKTKEQALLTRWQKEKQLVSDILCLEKTLNEHYQSDKKTDNSPEKKQLIEKMTQLELCQGEHPLVYPHVTKQTIADIISLWTGIPVGNMLKHEMDKLMQLETEIGQRVIGQVDPIKEISQAIRMSRTGLTDPRKPIGVFLMCGPSGVGKTETALALAEALYGGERNITTFNMTEFKEEHKVSMLLGSPAGYVGYGKGGVLTEAVRNNPYSVLLLDEMEKSHPSVHDIFYQIFDKGVISDSEGRQVDFRNTIIIMTSNAADVAVVDACSEKRPSITDLNQIILPQLHSLFKSAFLGRTTIIPYYPLNDQELEKIAILSLNKVAHRVEERYQATLQYDKELVDYLIKLNTTPEMGARAIEQLINRCIMPILAEKCIARMIEKLTITKVNILLKNNVIDIDIS